MPEEGDYLLTNVGFSLDEKPCISMQRDGRFYDFSPLDQTITLQFDTTTRHCVGWRNIASGERFCCPDDVALESKYEQCPACQEKTGFNPAFYYASSVSSQQEARNQEPHILYLARFGKGIVKVGISYAKRERSRLLEQGARDAIILDTFPSANIARQYEAKIAAMPGIVETLQLRKKLSLIEQPYDHSEGKAELEATKATVESQHKVHFSGTEVLNLDPIFFPHGTPDLSQSFCSSDQNLITGHIIGSLGAVLFCLYQDTPVYLPIKKYVGYHMQLLYKESSLELPAQQTTLF